jgi:hypothetical protein
LRKDRKFTEDELQPFAKSNCKKCLGTGRTGYINGVAQTCRCVKQSLHRVMIAGKRAIKTLREEGIDA